MKTHLLAVCGLAPQVITETLYALHQQGRKVDSIHVLTTRDGKDACIAGLFGAGDGHFYRYLDEYGISRDSIDFGPRHIVSVLHEDGSGLDHITSEEDNERFLAACMEKTFELTRDSHDRVLFSIAGGPKTVGACLSLAAQCYGRPQDRIYHVLVTPEFEGCRDFYFPPKEPVDIQVKTRGRERKDCVMSTAEATITLVPMPFFSLRSHLTAQMLRQPESPAALMLSLVREEKPELVVDLCNRKICWKGAEAELAPAHLAFFTFFAQEKKSYKCRKTSCRGCGECFLSYPQIRDRQVELTTLYSKILPNRAIEEMSSSGISALSLENFLSYRSKINRIFVNTFGPYESKNFQILPSSGAAKCYGISQDRKQLKIIY